MSKHSTAIFRSSNTALNRTASGPKVESPVPKRLIATPTLFALARVTLIASVSIWKTVRKSTAKTRSNLHYFASLNNIAEKDGYLLCLAPQVYYGHAGRATSVEVEKLQLSNRLGNCMDTKSGIEAEQWLSTLN